MRNTLAIAAAFITIVTGVLAPRIAAAGDAPFGEPPRTANGAQVRMALVRWYFFIDNGKCVLTSRNQAKRAIGNIDRMIHRLPAAEQGVWRNYRNTITRHFAAQQRGVPGVGTWTEIIAKRDEALRWYPANKPKKESPKTDAEFAAYAKSIKAYRTRAETDRAYLAKVWAWPCARLRTWNLAKWRYYVRESQVSRILVRAQRANAPALHYVKDAKRFIDKNKDAAFKAPLDYGRMLLDAVSLYTNLQKDLANEKRVLAWAEAMGPKEVARATADLDAARAAMKQIAAIYAANIKKVRMPKKAGGSRAQRIARRVVGKQLRVHAASGIRKVNNPQSEVFRRAGKLWKRSWNESLDEVDIWYMSRDKPKKWFVDMPGVPLKKVCSLRTATAHRYRRGLGIKLNKWLQEEDALISPILCSAR